MPLEDDQRRWLDLALQSKGKFTTKKSIRNQFDDYQRRRQKTADALGGMAGHDPARAVVEAALEQADADAEAGHFKRAYKALDSAKKLARASANGRSDQGIADDMRIPLNVVRSTLDTHENMIDFHARQLAGFVASLANLDRAGDQPTLDAALAVRAQFAAQEATLRGRFQGIRDAAMNYQTIIQSRDLGADLDEIDGIRDRLTTAGLADAIAEQSQRLDDYRRRAEADNKKLIQTRWLFGKVREADKALEDAISDIRSLEAFQSRDAQDETPDAGSAAFRAQMLDPTDNRQALLQREEARIAAALQQMQADLQRDTVLTTNTDRPDIHTIPEPEKFDAGDVFGDLHEAGQGLSLNHVDEIKREGAAALRQFLQATPADDPRMFDLMLKDENDFKAMMALELLGVDDPSTLEAREKLLIDEVAAELHGALCASSPNALSADGQVLRMGADTYDFDRVLGRGAGGEAQRFIKRGTGETVVVKKPIPNPHEPEEGRKRLIMDLENHYRLMQGRADDGSSALTEMHGAARSPDGGLFVLMEEVRGGDVDAVDASLHTMASTGVLSEEARQVMAVDLIRKAVTALKEMEAMGFVHNDLKGANIMLTENGEIRIIDFDQSRFGDDDGKVARGNNEFAGTAGYFAADDAEFSSKSDAFALGGLLQKLVANLKPAAWRDTDVDFQSGSLGRLIGALRQDNPDERPNYDAVLASSYMNAPAQDYSQHDIADLRIATTEMSRQMDGMRINIDLDPDDADDEETAARKAYMTEAFSVYVQGYRPGETTEMSMKALQMASAAVDTDLRTAMQAIKGDGDPAQNERAHAEIKRLLDFRNHINNQMINPAVEARAEAGKTAYEAEVENPQNTMELDVGKGPKTLTYKNAVIAREKVAEMIRQKQEAFYAEMANDDDIDFDRAVGANADLERYEALLKDIDRQLFTAMGSDAKFYLARQKVADVSKRFGQAQSTQSHEPPKQDPLDDLIGELVNHDVAKEVKQAAG